MAQGPLKIVPSREYLEGLSKKYDGLKYREESVKKWFYEDGKIFFDCAEGVEKEDCLKSLLNRRDLTAFTVIFIVKKRDAEGAVAYELMNVNFSNIGGRTLSGFTSFYHLNLEFMTKLSLQARKLDYVECVGYSYTE